MLSLPWTGYINTLKRLLLEKNTCFYLHSRDIFELLITQCLSFSMLQLLAIELFFFCAQYSLNSWHVNKIF